MKRSHHSLALVVLRLAPAVLVALGLANIARPAAAQLGGMSGSSGSSSSRSTLGGSATGGMGGLATQARSSNSNGLNANMTAQDFRNTAGNSLLSQSFGMGGANGGGRMGGMNGFGGMGMGMGMGGMGMGGFNRMGMLGGMNGMNSQNPRARLKVPMRLSFSVPPEAIAQRASQFQTRVSRLPSIEELGNVTVKVEDGKAILSGDVPTTEDSELVERLALLEPGIDSVENNLTVVPEAADAEKK
ncbi:MAG: BON domain-containing protein [Planctomycetota bacterium]